MEACDLLFQYIKLLFEDESDIINENIFDIMKIVNYSKNTILFDQKLKEKIINMNIKIKEGTIPIREYKIFDENFENTDIECIRKNSSYVKGLSVDYELYEKINNLEMFFRNFSESYFDIEDFIKILLEKSFVNNCNITMLSRIYALFNKKSKSKSINTKEQN